jgi:hypothetical protein
MDSEDNIRAALRPIIEDAGGAYTADSSILFPAFDPDNPGGAWNARHADARLLRFVAMVSTRLAGSPLVRTGDSRPRAAALA